MKKIFLLLTALSIILCLCSCDVQIIIQPKTDENEAETNTETVTEENKPTDPPKNETEHPAQPAAPQNERITPKYTNSAGVTLNAHFSVEVPAAWKGKYSTEGASFPDFGGYYINFFSTKDEAKGFGGTLFEVFIYPDNEDYSSIASYDELGRVSISGEGNFNVIIVHPTDVQFDEKDQTDYMSMYNYIYEVIASIDFNSSCNYTAGKMFEVSQAPAPAPVVSDYIFPSDTQYITEADLSWRSKDEIVLMRNEIYARHGYIFNMEQFKTYFGAKSWYSPNPNFSTKMFNKIEQANIDFIVKYEKKMGWK